uniref:WW domain-containing protein n=1 Tax=Heliothis virescens TaxID=7102 RepID=A0A2A4K2U6_HELVI
MSKSNPLAGLLANYGDSDEDSDDGMRAPPLPPEPNIRKSFVPPLPGQSYANQSAAASAAVHPAPIAHCPWSACYDESSGFTYYWNQITNAVTWEAPPEYLLALKLAQQQLHVAGSAEVSAEEWQLYQQALAEKQNSQNNKVVNKSSSKVSKKTDRNSIGNKDKSNKYSKKRTHSDDEDEKIELITSYHNSDSESNDEAETPTKPQAPPLPKPQAKLVVPNKKPKVKPVEYGPALPPKQNYTVPIGPELPPELINNGTKSPENSIKEDKKQDKTNDEDIQDESALFLRLKNKAKLLEKLGGELPKDLQKIIEEDPRSGSNTPKREENISKSNANIDELLEEIEKRELPKVVKTKKVDGTISGKSSPKGDVTPPIEAKPLFPSIQNIDDTPVTPPSIPPNPPLPIEVENEEKKVDATEKKGVNLYLVDSEERRDVGKKKLRISNSVLPDRKRGEEPAYTTKYSQFIEGFSNERTGLGFSKDEDENESPKNAINYGNGLMFTKGETLNEDKKDEDLDDLTDLLEAKLKYLNQLQPCVVTPVQEMLIQMQTLVGAFRFGALSAGSEGRYCYRREADGLVQWEYPATTHTDMEICTTPPHPGIDAKDEVPPPLPPTPPPALAPPPPTIPSTWSRAVTPPPPSLSGTVIPAGPSLAPSVLATHSAGTPGWPRARTPPPPAWADPPPPGCDDLPPLPANSEQKQEIGDELASFYSDIAELEKQTSGPHTASNSPEPVDSKDKHRDKGDKDKDAKVNKKKSKVKISASMGLKHKSVSNLVAKWQQVADEINSD